MPDDAINRRGTVTGLKMMIRVRINCGEGMGKGSGGAGVPMGGSVGSGPKSVASNSSVRGQYK